MSSFKGEGYDEVHIDIDEREDNAPVVGLTKLQSKKSIVAAIVDHEEKNKEKTESPPKPPKIQTQSPQSPQSPKSVLSFVTDTDLNVTNDGTKDHEVFNLASIIFTHADLDHSGIVYIDEFMESTNLSMELSKATLRSMKCIDSFELDNLYQYIKTLKHGSLEEKVQILHSYIDKNRDGGINEEEFNELFKIKNTAVNAKLGFDGSPDYKLTYDHLLSIFKSSPKGDDVINSFCNEILEILSKVAIETIRDSKTNRRKSSKKSAQKSYYERVTEYIINFAKDCVGSKKNRFLTVLVLLQLFLWLYYFCYYYVYLGKPQELAIAKGFGLNLRILSIGMFFTMCRSTLGNLYLVAYLDKIIPLGLNLEIHSFVGISVLFHSIGHVFAHISYEYIRTDGGPTATVLQKSLTNGGWSYRYTGSGDGVTGYILLGIILFMSISAMCRGQSSKFYAVFYHLHIVGYLLWATFLYLHVYSLWHWWLAIVILYMGDMCYDLIFLTTISNLSLSRPGPDGVTFISLYSTNKPEAGSYYRIKVPSISLTEWHSFSFAGNSSSNHLKFFIASAGDWTSALHELVSDPARRDKALVIVIGPYKAPAEKLFRSHKYEGRAKNCLVASGIGITPFLSCIATDIMNALNAESNKDTFDALFHEDLVALRRKTTTKFTEEDVFAEDDESRILHVIWSIREIGELMFFIEYIYQLVKLQDHLTEKIVTIDIYLTGLGSIHDPKYLIAQTFFSLIVREKTTSNMNIFYSRPNFDSIVQTIKPKSMYYCGGAIIREMLDPICAKYNIKVTSLSSLLSSSTPSSLSLSSSSLLLLLLLSL